MNKTWKNLYWLACFCCAFLFADLPAPYDSVQNIRPFVDHGWYQNEMQLRALIYNYRIKTIVEVGSWLGKSTIDLARALPPEGKIYAVDHWEGSAEHQIGNSAWHPSLPYLYEQFLSNIIHSGLTEKVVPIKMDSLEAARSLTVQPDLIYIDANHETEAVYRDLCAWYPFVKGRGILCGDDWCWPSVRSAVVRFAAENQLQIDSYGNFWRLIE